MEQPLSPGPAKINRRHVPTNCCGGNGQTGSSMPPGRFVYANCTGESFRSVVVVCRLANIAYNHIGIPRLVRKDGVDGVFDRWTGLENRRLRGESRDEEGF
jgi:hypothetical protein